MTSSRKLITVIFPLYNTEHTVAELFDSIENQNHPDSSLPENWMDVIFIDDGSTDKTVQIAHEEFKKRGEPKYIRIVENKSNLGLSRSLNRAYSLSETQFVLTCQCDCRFASQAYVADMLTLMNNNPKVAAITGQPRIDFSKNLSFCERVNLVANIMDIVPENTDKELIPVGFCEGRCDAFRISAFKKIDFYDTNLRISGEDQVMSRMLRLAGFEVAQAPKLFYYLSISNEQNTLWKLAKHQHLFGKTQPYILFVSGGTRVAGFIGDQAGLNRSLRTLLRASQLLFGLGLIIAGGLALGFGQLTSLVGLIALASVFKYALFNKHLKIVPFSFAETLRFFAVLPIFDLFYFIGFIEGLCRLLQRRKVDQQLEDKV